MEYKSVVFDFDGTLFDTASNELRTLATLVEKAMGSYPKEEKLLQAFGMPGYKAMEYLGCNQEQMGWIWPQWYKASVEALKTTPMFEGVKDVILALHKIGLPLGVVTSRNLEGVRVGLEAHGILRCFTALVCKEDTEQHKPAPDPLIVCANRLGVDTDQILYIGDNEVDMLCAKAAGACGGLALWGAHNSELPCNCKFEYPKEILTLFDV